MSKIPAKNFTPVIDSMAEKYGLITAAVFGRIWRFCQGHMGICQATLETIGKDLHLDSATVCRHAKVLVEAGYLEDITPDLRHRPHSYKETGKAKLEMSIEAIDKDDIIIEDFTLQGATPYCTQQLGIAESTLKRGLREDLREPLKLRNSPTSAVGGDCELLSSDSSLPDTEDAKIEYAEPGDEFGDGQQGVKPKWAIPDTNDTLLMQAFLILGRKWFQPKEKNRWKTITQGIVSGAINHDWIRHCIDYLTVQPMKFSNLMTWMSNHDKMMDWLSHREGNKAGAERRAEKEKKVSRTAIITDPKELARVDAEYLRAQKEKYAGFGPREK